MSEKKPGHESPTEGGSYFRQKDGTLTRRQEPALTGEAQGAPPEAPRGGAPKKE